MMFPVRAWRNDRTNNGYLPQSLNLHILHVFSQAEAQSSKEDSSPKTQTPQRLGFPQLLRLKAWSLF